ncbi:MAG: ferritin-like domain-containing protein [Clostridia bacterium]|nr:ferritin-like domain-containing protein [Clostridia bacterium]
MSRTLSYRKHFKTAEERDSVLANIKAGIITELQAIALYQELMTRARSTKHKDYISHALEDEEKHAKKFRELFITLTGSEPDVGEIESINFTGYKDGLIKSFEREMEVTELYRDTIMLTENKLVRQVMFEAMSDEQEHTDKFNCLYHEVYKR